MSQSEKIDLLAAALAKAQGQIEGAVKDSTNPHFKSKYADLASVWDACRKPLSDNGLSVVQMPGMPLLMDNGQWIVPITTTLLHASGQWISQEGGVVTAKADGQGVVAAITYGRRGALAAFTGVAPIDDDGESIVEQMPPCDHPGCRNGARYQEGTQNFCGQHRSDKPAPAPRNPANGKQALGEKLVAQERWRKAIVAAVEAKLIDSIHANPSAEYGKHRKRLLGETLEMPPSWAEHLELSSVTLEQWTEAADRLFVRVQEATA